MQVTSRRARSHSQIVKRLFDIAASGVGLMFLCPVLFAIGLLVKMDTCGPVFFRQERVGRNGRPFHIYKFRTMRSVTPGSAPDLTVGDDPRITRAGRVLRHYKLDELPQLINVLIGDMSVVGPRPEVPRYVARWAANVRSVVLSVRPGLTDLASIAFRDESALLASSENPERTYIEEIAPAKNRLAMRYVETRSLWLDMTIIYKTFVAILR